MSSIGEISFDLCLPYLFPVLIAILLVLDGELLGNFARLAPEYPYPTWINDAWDALKWVSRHPGRMKKEP